MIGEVLIDLFFGLFSHLFSTMEIIGLPYQTIRTLSTILCYGNWIVGSDILALFTLMVVGWWTIHVSIGFAIWVWERLPLT